jgi:DNA replication protein DnaC
VEHIGEIGEMLIEKIRTMKKVEMASLQKVEEPSCKEDPDCRDGWIIKYRHQVSGEEISISQYVSLPNSDKRQTWSEVARECRCWMIEKKRRKTERILESSRLSPRFKKRTFDTFIWLDLDKYDEKLKPDIEKLVHGQRIGYRIALDYTINWEDHAARGEGFALFGDYGTGKTHLLAAKTIYLLERGIQSVFVNTAEIFQEIRNCFDVDDSGKAVRQIRASDILDLLKTCEDLSLDDVGKEKPSEWVRDVFYQIINHRYDHELPTSFTTNCSAEELKAHVGPATYRRLTEPCKGRAITIKGPSFDMIRK